MQFRHLNLVAGLLAASYVQAAAIPTSLNASSSITTSQNATCHVTASQNATSGFITSLDDVLASIDDFLAQMESSGLAMTKFNPHESKITTGFQVINEVTKMVGSLNDVAVVLHNAPVTTSLTFQDNLCNGANTITDSAVVFVHTFKSTLPKLIEQPLTNTLLVAVDILRNSFNVLRRQVRINSPSCAHKTDFGFDIVSSLMNTISVTNSLAKPG